MTCKTDTSETDRQRLSKLNFLFEPFGWMTGWVTTAIKSYPELLIDFCSMSRQRMHLVALSLSHLDNTAQQEVAHFLMRGRARDILDYVLGRRPRGLKRALSNLSFNVLSTASYRLLVELLEDPAAFKLLAHAPMIDDEDLERFASIPTDLRPLLAQSSNSWPGGRLDEGLQFLVMRGAAPSYQALLDQLRVFQQPSQLSAHLRKLVDSLSFPSALPPSTVGHARRLDSPDEIRDLAWQWRNCLSDIYLPRVDHGQCAIYLWEAPQSPAACAVERHGRLGWFLSEVNGPKNVGVTPERLSEIQRAFVAEGIPQDGAACAILGLMELGESARSRRRRHP